VNLETIPNGLYSIKFAYDRGDHTYRAEKKDDGWFLCDGTGWEERIHSSREIISITPAPTKRIEPNFNYGPLTWPLSEFFGLKE
jgi:hypothetical protein